MTEDNKKHISIILLPEDGVQTKFTFEHPCGQCKTTEHVMLVTMTGKEVKFDYLKNMVFKLFGRGIETTEQIHEVTFPLCVECLDKVGAHLEDVIENDPDAPNNRGN